MDWLALPERHIVITKPPLQTSIEQIPELGAQAVAQGHANGGPGNVSTTVSIAHYRYPNERNAMNRLNQTQKSTQADPSKQQYRKLWVEAVEQMAENTELRKRVDFLERQIATNAFGGWKLH
jgi:hypothetical protein